MRVWIKRILFLFCGVSCLMSPWSVSAFGAERPFERNGPIERLDDRYHHGHYYVPRGTVVRELPKHPGDMFRMAAWNLLG